MQNTICIAKQKGNPMFSLSQKSLSTLFMGATRPAASLRTLLSVAKERRVLKTLSQEQLSDNGYSAKEAAAEADRPMWDVPKHWKR